MEIKLTAYEWAKEIENKFILFFELFDTDILLEARSIVLRNEITLYIKGPIGVNLIEPATKKAIKSALNMATRGCPYEYTYVIEEQ